MSGLEGGEGQAEDRSASLPGQNRELALVLPDDGMAYREPEAGRILGGIKRLEDALAVGGRHPGSPVPDLGQRLGPFAAGAQAHPPPAGPRPPGAVDPGCPHPAPPNPAAPTPARAP